MIGQPEPTEDTPEKLLATAEGALDRFLGLDFKANQSRAGVDNLSQSRQFSLSLRLIFLTRFCLSKLFTFPCSFCLWHTLRSSIG